MQTDIQKIPAPSLYRLPMYFGYLEQIAKDGLKFVSSGMIAKEFGITAIQVRKDLAYTTVIGRPKYGYDSSELLEAIANLLGYQVHKRAILVGVGHLGSAILAYNGFKRYGLDITAAFDQEEAKHKLTINQVPILPLDELGTLVKEQKIKLAIITVPDHQAQEIADILVEAGILAIWNFAPVHLQLNENILVQNENLAASLSILSSKLTQRR